MRRLRYTREEREALLLAARDRLSFAANVRRLVRVDGEIVPARLIESADYGEEDGLAVVAEVVFSAPVLARQRLVGRDFRIDWVVAPTGRTLPGFLGSVVQVSDEGSKGTLTAATGGYEAARTPLGTGPEDDREYNATEPSTVLHDGLSMLEAAYEGFDIRRRARPRINRRNNDTVRWTQSVLDLVGIVRDEGRLVAADLPINVASAYADRAVDEEGATDWTFEENRDTLAGGIAVESADTERYAKVVVWRANRDGTHQRLTRPIEVDNRGRRANPRSVLPLEMTDDAVEMGLTPYEFGRQEADRLGRNEARVTINTIYPPFFLARGDSVTAVKRVDQGEDGVLVSTYRVRLDLVPVTGKTGAPAGPAALVSEELVERPRRRYRVARPFKRALWGRDVDGVPFFDTGLPWVSHREDENGTYAVLDTEVAAEYGVTIARDATVTGANVVEVTDEPPVP